MMRWEFWNDGYDSRPSAAILSSGRVPAPWWPPWTTPVGSFCTDSWSKLILGEGPIRGHADPCCSLERGLLGSVLGPPLILFLFWLLFKTFHISSFCVIKPRFPEGFIQRTRMRRGGQRVLVFNHRARSCASHPAQKSCLTNNNSW